MPVELSEKKFQIIEFVVCKVGTSKIVCRNIFMEIVRFTHFNKKVKEANAHKLLNVS